MISIHGRGRDGDSCVHFLLTAYDFSGKHAFAFTIAEFRQRRLSLTTLKPDDEVLNQGNLDEGFFLLLEPIVLLGSFRFPCVKSKGHDKDAWQMVWNSREAGGSMIGAVVTKKG